MRGTFDGPRGQGGFAPVKVGDEIDVKVESVGEKGDGVAKVKGFVLFVPNTKQGDEVHVKITRVLKKVGFAEVLSEATGTSSTSEDSSGESSKAEEPSEELPEDSEDFGEESEEEKY